MSGSPRTLRDHVNGYRVYARCDSCRHNVRVNLLHASQLVGWDGTLDQLKVALKCQVCGNRGAIELAAIPELRR